NAIHCGRVRKYSRLRQSPRSSGAGLGKPESSISNRGSQIMDKLKAVALLSGGVDSTTTVAIALNQGFDVYGLSFDYGQRHRLELERARVIAKKLGLSNHVVLTIDLRAFGGSALTSDLALPKHRSLEAIGEGIPITYVPARNTIFLSFAL